MIDVAVGQRTQRTGHFFTRGSVARELGSSIIRRAPDLVGTAAEALSEDGPLWPTLGEAPSSNVDQISEGSHSAPSQVRTSATTTSMLVLVLQLRGAAVSRARPPHRTAPSLYTED